MRKKISLSSTVMVLAIATTLLFGVAATADDGPSGPRALAALQHHYGDLGAKWWEWAFGSGFEGFGDGEVDCSAGQSGPVWYLAGTFGTPAERSCTVPRRKRLFFPLVNQLIFYEAGVDPEEFDLTTQEKRIFLDAIIGGGPLDEDESVAALAELIGLESTVACDLHATLDGEPLIFTNPIARGQSQSPVTITTDEDAHADGFYVLLERLDRGSHDLVFGGAFCLVSDGTRVFETTATYHLTVGRSGGGDDD